MARTTTRGRSRGASRGRGRGAMRGPRGPQRPPQERRARFETSRIEDMEDGGMDDSMVSDEGSIKEQELDDESGSDNEANADNSYSTLLQSLNARSAPAESSRKRRKLSHSDPDMLQQTMITGSKGEDPVSENDNLAEKIVENSFEASELNGENVGSDEDLESSSEDETASTDPFEQHFSNVDEIVLASSISAVEDKKITTFKTTMVETSVAISKSDSWPACDGALKDTRMKRRLGAAAASLVDKLKELEPHVAKSVLGYKDVICGTRDLRNAGRLRDLAALHALNHGFKTRDRVIKDNSKLAQQVDGALLDLRDQGFTRPKVLILVPTRNACVKFVDSIVRLSQPEQQENKSRFTAGFADQDDKTWDDKPEDFQDVFSGNDDDMFRLGLKFTRKTIKFFSAFYNSDVILASPLGLMRAIEKGSDKDEKKKLDADFLSSIEIVIMDNTNALLMQNWQHVEYIFSQLNLLPKESRGCDFSRVRNWYLDGHAKYLRQTIIFSDYLTPDINALASKYLFNVAGRTKYIPIYPGAMLQLPQTLPQGISQTFTRFHSPSPLTDADARFTHFTSTILPSLLQSHRKQSALIYLPTYTDFVRLRNHLSTSADTISLSFGTISEYTSVRDVARARSHFLNGRHSVLLYTERAHHFRRYKIRGVKRVIFYGVPENPLFWPELAGFLGLNEGDEKIDKSAVKAIFSKWDILKLERIVGTARIGRLISDKSGDMFEFT